MIQGERSRPDAEHDRRRRPALGELFGRKTRGGERVDEIGQGPVAGANLVPDSAVGPGVGGPVAVAVAGTDHDGIRVGAVGEAAAEARMDADVDEDAARTQHPGGLTKYGQMVVSRETDDKVTTPSTVILRASLKPLREAAQQGGG